MPSVLKKNKKKNLQEAAAQPGFTLVFITSLREISTCFITRARYDHAPCNMCTLPSWFQPRARPSVGPGQHSLVPATDMCVSLWFQPRRGGGAAARRTDGGTRGITDGRSSVLPGCAVCGAIRSSLRHLLIAVGYRAWLADWLVV